MKFLEDFSEFVVWVGLACLVVFALGLSGCAGYQAMAVERPPMADPCAIRVCEKVNPRDKECWREYCVKEI